MSFRIEPALKEALRTAAVANTSLARSCNWLFHCVIWLA
jgi:hypothetical protein